MRHGDSILELDTMRRRDTPAPGRVIFDGLTFGSLFAGIGGFDLGLERAGLRCAWQVEINPFARAVLAEHWPTVPRFTDVRSVGARELGPVDLICGGFPCQDISNAGNRIGIGGARSGLWTEYARIVRELRPRYVVVENVAALLIRGFGAVLADLAASGYAAEWEVFRASDVGAPHRRERLFLVAYAERLAGGDDEQRDQGGPAVERQESGEASSRRLADAADPRRESGPARTGRETRDLVDRVDAQWVGDVANADGRRHGRVGLAQSSRVAGPCGDQPDRSRAHREQLDAAHVADADGARFGECGRVGGDRPGDARALPDDGGDQVADAECAGSQGPRQAAPAGRAESAAGTSVFAHLGPVPAERWPSGPGAEQHDWEPPRVIPPQSALGRVPNGLSADVGGSVAAVAPRHRRRQLEAYGNAVVPALAEWLGRAVVAHNAAMARTPQDGTAGHCAGEDGG